MRTIPLSAQCMRFAATTVLLATMLSPALAQSRLERSGITLYWGLVPAAAVAYKHALAEQHGGPPQSGEQGDLVVLVPYDIVNGRRIDDAVVRVELSATGIVDEPVKYLVPMRVNDQAGYGKVFGVVKEGPYRFRPWARPHPQPLTDKVEFTFATWSPHLSEH